MITIVEKVGQYLRNNEPRFVYKIKGSVEELKEYKQIQGANYREDESKNPLFFSKTPIANGTSLTKSNDGTRFFVEKDLEKQASKLEDLQLAFTAKIKSIVDLGYSKEEAVRMVMAV